MSRRLRSRAVRCLGGALVAAAVGGCGGDSDDGAREEPATIESSTAPPEFRVEGVIKADLLGAWQIKRNPDRCVITGDVGTILREGAKSVVISAPDGSEVALGSLGVGEPKIVSDSSGDFYATGICDFSWVADVPEVDGVYTAALPDLDVEVRFQQGDRPVLRVGNP